MLPIMDLDETRGTLGSLKKLDKNSIEFHQQLGKSTIIVDVFGSHNFSFLFEWVKYYCIVFKSIWETWQKWDENLKFIF